MDSLVVLAYNWQKRTLSKEIISVLYALENISKSELQGHILLIFPGSLNVDLEDEASCSCG